ncbi:MAG: hypothetical protein ABI601_18415 [bacterium]
MIALNLSWSAIRALVTRAVVLWALLRALVTAVMLMASATGGSGDRLAGPRPFAVVVLCAVLGLVDLKRRREASLWANLGLSRTHLAFLFAIAATAGELLLATVRR